MKKLTLLEGWDEQLAVAKERQKEMVRHRLEPVPVDLAQASADILFVDTEEKASRLVEMLSTTMVAAVAYDSEYTFRTPGIELRSKRVWYDIRSQYPICISLAAWVKNKKDQAGYILRAVTDVRKPEVVPYLEQLFQLRVPAVFHHIKAELSTFWSLGIDPDLLNIHDTFLAAACLNLGKHHKRSRKLKHTCEAQKIRSESALVKKKKHSLSLVGQCAHYNLGYPFSESKDEHQDQFLHIDPAAPLTRRQIEYAAADAEYTLRLYAAQQPDIVREGLSYHLHTVEFPFAVANARMEWNGVHVDAESRKKLLQATKKASDHYGQALMCRGIDPPGSRDKFIAYMKRKGLDGYLRRNGHYSTEKGFLETIEKIDPVIRDFRLHRQYQRMAGEEWLTEAMVGADGRVHPNHFQLGAATGRNSCNTPNIVGIGKVLRPVVSAPPGRVIMELDYGQIEVGVAAAEHEDLLLIAAYNSGDVYAAMAQQFYADRLSDKERQLSAQEFKKRRPEMRNNMKTFVLAVIYNIQAKAIATRFGISEIEAEQERTRFLDMYPTLKRCLEESMTYGALRGYASVVSGLRRYREQGGRADGWTKNFLRNTPIQGSAAVVFKYAVVLMDREFRNTDTWLILPVHDAIVIECPADQLDDVALRAEQLMKQALRTYYPQLVPKVDVNKEHPGCWNKDGYADSLDKFLSDPTFQIDMPQARSINNLRGCEK